MFNEFSNRNSNIDDTNYGKLKQTKPSLEFSKEKVYEVAQRIIIQATQKFLPKRTIQSQTNTSDEYDVSRDSVAKIIQRRESDVIIQPEVPQIEVTKEKENKPEEEKKLDIAIKEEVPNELPIPKFTKPNPTKSKKKNIFKQKFLKFGGGARPQLDNNIKSRTL